jgi:hypothetical protein
MVRVTSFLGVSFDITAADVSAASDAAVPETIADRDCFFGGPGDGSSEEAAVGAARCSTAIFLEITLFTAEVFTTGCRRK